jgi:hypothetical protein
MLLQAFQALRVQHFPMLRLQFSENLSCPGGCYSYFFADKAKEGDDRIMIGMKLFMFQYRITALL